MLLGVNRVQFVGILETKQTNEVGFLWVCLCCCCCFLSSIGLAIDLQVGYNFLRKSQVLKI